jgi:hypothetical protein
MATWWQQVVQGLKRKLREWREVLEAPVVPNPGLVPVPVRPRRDRRPR